MYVGAQVDVDEEAVVADWKGSIVDVNVNVNAVWLRVLGSILDSSGSS